MSLESTKLEKLETLPVKETDGLKECSPISEHPIESVNADVEGKELSSEKFPTLESFRSYEKEQLEALDDAEVTESIAEYLSGIEELKYENWTHLDLEQRKTLLNRIEQQIANIEHRPPLPINVEKMEDKTFGYQSSYFHLIALNSKYVMSNSKADYNEVLDTIIHEGRHAYQHYNVDTKCIHSSQSVVETWRENFYDPKYKYYSGSPVMIIGRNNIGDVGYRLYYYQPVEIDARNFASDVMLKLKQRGFIN